ncbi:MAG: oligosaccharide flippase family protein [Cyclobacteriaceae bacterium]|nr:oligosaccharide flippase family protein [Cyclobacteriaceae bacterium]
MNINQPSGEPTDNSADHPLVSIRNFSIYSILSIFQKASTFLLLPVYTYYLSPEDFGIVSVATAVATLVPPLVMLNTSEYVYFTSLKRDPGWERGVSSIVGFQVMVIAGVMALGFAGIGLLPDSFAVFGVPFFPYLFFSIAFAVLSVIYTSYSLMLQGLNEVKRFSTLNISFSILFAALVIILMTVFDLKAMSFIYANLVLYAGFGSFILWKVWRRFGLTLNGSEIRKGLGYAAPLVPHTLSHWGKGYLDRVLLSSFISTTAAGLFHFASTIGSILIVGLEAFVKVNNPYFYANFEDLSKRDSIVSRLHLAAAFFSLIGIALSFFSHEWMWFFDITYSESYLLLPFLVTGNLVYLIYLGVVNVLFVKKKTLIISMLTFSSGIISSLGSYLLIRNFGLNGAAYSHVFSNVTISLLVFAGVQRFDFVPWKLYRLLFMLALPLAGILINTYSFGIMTKILISLVCMTAVLYTVRSEAGKVLRQLGINVRFLA